MVTWPWTKKGKHFSRHGLCARLLSYACLLGGYGAGVRRSKAVPRLCSL